MGVLGYIGILLALVLSCKTIVLRINMPECLPGMPEIVEMPELPETGEKRQDQEEHYEFEDTSIVITV